MVRRFATTVYFQYGMTWCCKKSTVRLYFSLVLFLSGDERLQQYEVHRALSFGEFKFLKDNSNGDTECLKL